MSKGKYSEFKKLSHLLKKKEKSMDQWIECSFIYGKRTYSLEQREMVDKVRD
jgi:hypothetical protein